MSDDTTHFGYREVKAGDKARMVGRVFASVASRYDLMNDLMSLGVHRLWKQFAVGISGVRAGQHVVDVAGGTGDLSARLARRVGSGGSVVCTDINDAMLEVGRDRLLDRGYVHNIEFVRADAESLPFADNSFDVATIAFGLRNVTRKEQALQSMQRVVRPGGCVVVLEFSKLVLPLMQRVYDRYSFTVLPRLGEWVARDRDSYQYLVESIRRHPDQETLAGMMREAGLERVTWNNLSGGIAAVHRGYKL
jgi:demethylmenaquinone methyltransferase/2-methoxy-6-polyprenyl-1,4-benzoquinol methylase